MHDIGRQAPTLRQIIDVVRTIPAADRVRLAEYAAQLRATRNPRERAVLEMILLLLTGPALHWSTFHKAHDQRFGRKPICVRTLSTSGTARLTMEAVPAEFTFE
jgi:hypothetical protein